MSVNSIPGDAAAFVLKPLPRADSLEQPLQGASSTSNVLSKQTAQSNNPKASAIEKVSSVKEKSPEAGTESRKKPVRVMNHVVEVYNRQGKVRTKFMDSKNDVIYQIPSEMVANMEDQMMASDAYTITKV